MATGMFPEDQFAGMSPAQLARARQQGIFDLGLGMLGGAASGGNFGQSLAGGIGLARGNYGQTLDRNIALARQKAEDALEAKKVAEITRSRQVAEAADEARRKEAAAEAAATTAYRSSALAEQALTGKAQRSAAAAEQRFAEWGATTSRRRDEMANDLLAKKNKTPEDFALLQLILKHSLGGFGMGLGAEQMGAPAQNWEREVEAALAGTQAGPAVTRPAGVTTSFAPRQIWIPPHR